jgi:hypothetical protein
MKYEVAFVVGVILPLAGMLWGPGSWWTYLIWLAVGLVGIALLDKLEEDGNDQAGN